MGFLPSSERLSQWDIKEGGRPEVHFKFHPQKYKISPKSRVNSVDKLVLCISNSIARIYSPSWHLFNKLDFLLFDVISLLIFMAAASIKRQTNTSRLCDTVHAKYHRFRYQVMKPENERNKCKSFSPQPSELFPSPYYSKPHSPAIHQAKVMDIGSWICELPNSGEWAESDLLLIFTLASAGKKQGDSSRSIQLRVERTSESNSEAFLIFKICFEGFQPSDDEKPIWLSDACPLSSEQPSLPVVLQLLQETVNRSPAVPDSTCPRSQLQKLKPEPISWIMESHSSDSFSSFFNLVFLTRLFWLCARDAPSEIGSFYFQSLLGPNIETLTCKQAPVLWTFLVPFGVDNGLCFMRTLVNILAKWMILREVSVELQNLTPLPRQHFGISYATEAHGFWTFKGYALVNAMKLMHSSDQRSKFPAIGAKESLLRYALAHQQLEVRARVDKRLHVAKLGFRKKEDAMDYYFDERHFPSRIRVWVGPEVGSTYVSGLSLGCSTDNGGREVETQRIVKESFGKSKTSGIKAKARVSMRNKTKNWRWDQDAEGNTAVFDAVLSDSVTGHEIATWKSFDNGNSLKCNNSFQNRYYGVNRPFTKAGGLVFAGDDYGERVGWRLSKEMEGSVLKWRNGGEVRLSYWPNNIRNSYVETMCVEMV
ncbi:uncharacterized protein LOC111281650 [Durio zibethinus]|uniref:Uncharacterized protein LOC111281650 n=1 Tax=Durio zibethinus TaxID=66656 RepID=A0A6P5X9J9_DURZI|nr:uncharacterized protein LOC111281650 [Durio zibethinus]